MLYKSLQAAYSLFPKTPRIPPNRYSPAFSLDSLYAFCYPIPHCGGAVAQLGERMTGSHEVDSSILFSSTI